MDQRDKTALERRVQRLTGRINYLEGRLAEVYCPFWKSEMMCYLKLLAMFEKELKDDT